jgi:hypothetical protein
MTTDHTSRIDELRAFAAADDPAAPPTLEGLMAALAADFLEGYSTQELNQWPAAREAILAARRAILATTPEARQQRADAALAERATELHGHAANLRASVAHRDVSDEYRRGTADAAAYLTLTARQLDPTDPSPKTIPATHVP